MVLLHVGLTLFVPLTPFHSQKGQLCKDSKQLLLLSTLAYFSLASSLVGLVAFLSWPVHAIVCIVNESENEAEEVNKICDPNQA